MILNECRLFPWRCRTILLVNCINKNSCILCINHLCGDADYIIWIVCCVCRITEYTPSDKCITCINLIRSCGCLERRVRRILFSVRICILACKCSVSFAVDTFSIKYNGYIIFKTPLCNKSCTLFDRLIREWISLSAIFVLIVPTYKFPMVS